MTFITKSFNELVSIMNQIFLSFNLSEHYFKKVTEEYPESPYTEDAADKIALLKKLYSSYENGLPEADVVLDTGRFIKAMGLKIERT